MFADKDLNSQQLTINSDQRPVKNHFYNRAVLLVRVTVPCESPRHGALPLSVWLCCIRSCSLHTAPVDTTVRMITGPCVQLVLSDEKKPSMRYHLQPGCLRVLEGADPGGQFRSVQLLGLGQGLGHYLHTPVTGQLLGKGCF